jgi:hypothetical protein
MTHTISKSLPSAQKATENRGPSLPSFGPLAALRRAAVVLCLAALTFAAQPLSSAYASPLDMPTGSAIAASRAASRAPSVESVVTIRNLTDSPITYAIQWPGSTRKSFTVQARTAKIHWTGGQTQTATITYSPNAPGAPSQTAHLTARDFAGSRPGHNRDGMEYSFIHDNSGLRLQARWTLNRSNLSQFRHGVTATNAFPKLLSNFEVLAGPGQGKMYNCIAHSLGYHDRWVNPITSRGANKLASMDALYAKQGYKRISHLDYRVQAGHQKVVVYAKVSKGGITEVTHAAIQSRDGSWTSKLGRNALIRHLFPEDLAGGEYGVPVAIYVKKL